LRGAHIGLAIASQAEGERIGPMPELEALFAPVRLKLEALKEPDLRRRYVERATEATEHTRAAGDTACPFVRLAQLQNVVLQVAKATLGTRGGKIRPMHPRYSAAFQRLAAHVRLLRVVHREIRDRRGTVLPASRAMQRLWHRDREAFPEGTAFAC
jgi:hypothetical protein